MKMTLWLLMGFAGALPVALTVVSFLFYGRKSKEMHTKLGLAPGDTPPYEACPASSYVRGRVDPTIQSYSSRATAFSIYHICFTIMQLTYSAMIAVVLAITDSPGIPGTTKIFSAVLGAAVSILSGIKEACKFKERWLQYLDLRDKLFAERSIFLCAQIYQGVWRSGEDGARHNFVEKCEGIIALECRNLSDNLNKPEESSHGGRAQGEGKAQG
ncbi:MAG: DUF4231 domain-containing protein [Firmicutes bacterium]|nr:DUF4231 domain-containing protein [Bacillota bacterium]